jgi:tetratricopeptide (TPR) repeat protein
MFKKIVSFTVLAALIAGMCFLNIAATKRVFETQPSWYFLTPHSYKKFAQILGVGFGFRALLADFEYISFLQYYGDKLNRPSKFIKLFSYIDDITNADPHFTFAYTYGSAILAFNINRYDEAIKIIEKGLKYNPAFWKLRFYLAAITFSQLEDKSQYVKYLEEALKFNDYPAMIETLLGNIYEQYKPADFCAEYWAGVYKKSKDKDNRMFAYKRILALIESKRLQNPDLIIKNME